MNAADCVAPRKIEEVADELAQAEAERAEAAHLASIASQRETRGINVVNRLQKEFDALVATTRQGADRSTDWGQAKLTKFRADETSTSG